MRRACCRSSACCHIAKGVHASAKMYGCGRERYTSQPYCSEMVNINICMCVYHNCYDAPECSSPAWCGEVDESWVPPTGSDFDHA